MIWRGDFIEGSYTVFIQKGKDDLRVKKEVDSLSVSHVDVRLFTNSMLFADNIY